jgi:hypothetical protein
MQSFVRHVAPVTHDIEYRDVANKKEIAVMMDKLKLDIVEAEILTGTDDLEKAGIVVESWGCPEILITHSQGVLARVKGKTYYEKFSNRNSSGRTGRGDTTFSAYLSWRLDHDVATSLKFAAALVSIKMETPGPFKGTLEDVAKRLKEKHSALSSWSTTGSTPTGRAGPAAAATPGATRFAPTPASPMVAVFAPAAPPRSSGYVNERRASRTFSLKNPAP